MKPKAQTIVVNQQGIIMDFMAFYGAVVEEVEELKSDLIRISGELNPDLESKFNAIKERLEGLKNKIANWEFENIWDFFADVKAELELLKADLDFIMAEVAKAGLEAQAEIEEAVTDIKAAVDALWESILGAVGEPIGSWLEKYKKYFIWAAIAAVAVIGGIVLL